MMLIEDPLLTPQPLEEVEPTNFTLRVEGLRGGYEAGVKGAYHTFHATLDGWSCVDFQKEEIQSVNEMWERFALLVVRTYQNVRSIISASFADWTAQLVEGVALFGGDGQKKVKCKLYLPDV